MVVCFVRLVLSGRISIESRVVVVQLVSLLGGFWLEQPVHGKKRTTFALFQFQASTTSTKRKHIGRWTRKCENVQSKTNWRKKWRNKETKNKNTYQSLKTPHTHSPIWFNLYLFCTFRWQCLHLIHNQRTILNTLFHYAAKNLFMCIYNSALLLSFAKTFTDEQICQVYLWICALVFL